MAETSTATDYATAVPHLTIDAAGTPSLGGIRCDACETVIAGHRLACPACGGRAISAVTLANRGRVHAHTVVHRSYPGVKTPFVAAVVDLDGGGTVRGTLVDIDPLAELPKELVVEMVFRESGQHDRQGRPFIAYYFKPEGAAAQ